MDKTSALILWVVIGMMSPQLSQAQDATAKPVAFEVASIRPHDGPLSRIFDFSSSGPTFKLEAVVTPMLVMEAFDLKRYQLAFAASAMPPDQTYYNIVAKAEGNTARTRAQFRPMLQTLLAERFKLKFHREMRTMRVYALEVGKDGPRFKPSDPGATPYNLGSVNGRNHVWTNSHETMEGLAKQMQNYFGVSQPVVDKTGLTGTFDIKMEATPEYRLNGPPQPEDISVFDALQRVLGLKLVSSMAEIEVLVVDHIEKPSEN